MAFGMVGALGFFGLGFNFDTMELLPHFFDKTTLQADAGGKLSETAQSPEFDRR
jgi:hypothetical protein